MYMQQLEQKSEASEPSCKSEASEPLLNTVESETLYKIVGSVGSVGSLDRGEASRPSSNTVVI